MTSLLLDKKSAKNQKCCQAKTSQLKMLPTMHKEDNPSQLS